MPAAASRTILRTGRPHPSHRYFDGNLLLQQVRSEIGSDRRQRATLRSLGLGKIGGTAICDSASKSVRDQVASVYHLLSVSPLTLDAAEFARSEPASDLAEIDRVDTPAFRRRSFVGPYESFANIELDGHGRIAVAWASALPIATALDRSASIVGTGVRDAIIGDPRRQGTLEIPGAEAREALTRGPTDAAFVRLRFEGLSLVWSQATYPTHVDQYIFPGSIGVRADVRSVLALSLESLIAETATPEVASSADDLVDAARSLGGRDTAVQDLQP